MTTDELMAEIARLRDTLKRIEALVWYEPQDDDDTVEAVRAMVRERDEARRDLGEILAVIHRDGGHHTGEWGVSQSVADAHATWASVVRERDEMRAAVERLRNDLARCREVQKATAEGWRHEVSEVASIVGAPPHTAELAACVRAEVERLRAAAEESEHQMRLRIRAGYDKTIADSWRAKVAEVEAERDHERTVANEQLARAHDAVRERDDARAEIERLRGDAGLNYLLRRLMRERDEARAEVERLRMQLAAVGATTAPLYTSQEREVLIQQPDEARRDLVALLAVIHRDGGHHTGEWGVSQSVADAHATWASVVRERDEMRAAVERLRALINGHSAGDE